MTPGRLAGLFLALAVVALGTLFSGVPAALAQDPTVNICSRTETVEDAILDATATNDVCGSVPCL